ncbi:MAG: hypothetical protein F4087_16115 [Gemmatimonadetes bacterium]|nr:hypothetical protein [Gemmatimonadota bacterium]MYE94361.1 hypothetical protein [Gemmatimonadota bacterium]MYJ70017.1 hypothetical protein [Gemmatimonadota bacterium]
MKKQFSLVFALMCVLAISGGTSAFGQDGEQESPLCKSIKQTRDLACAEADEREATASTHEEIVDAMRYRLLCMRNQTDYYEFCMLPD